MAITMQMLQCKCKALSGKKKYEAKGHTTRTFLTTSQLPVYAYAHTRTRKPHNDSEQRAASRNICVWPVAFKLRGLASLACTMPGPGPLRSALLQRLARSLGLALDLGLSRECPLEVAGTAGWELRRTHKHASFL
jgi:hypothetical protein